MGSSNITEAAGVWFFATNTQRYLYLLRSGSKYNGTWGLPGGKVEAGESLLDAITRECVEEMGFMPEYTKLVPVEKFVTPDGKFVYHTFFCLLSDEFTPKLNHEHSGYSWLNKGSFPRPLHPGLNSTLKISSIYKKTKIVEDLYTINVRQ